MKKLYVSAAVVVALSGAAHAQYGGNGSALLGGGSYVGNGSALQGTGSNPNAHGVGGYVNSNGTYVAPHMQTNPNGTQLDNYGTRGNVNPYTGAVGTRYGRY